MFAKLAQANVDHFNNHGARHKTIMVVGSVAAVVVINKMAERLTRVENAPR